MGASRPQKYARRREWQAAGGASACRAVAWRRLILASRPRRGEAKRRRLVSSLTPPNCSTTPAPFRFSAAPVSPNLPSCSSQPTCLHSDATLPRNNATCTFWKAAEGFSVTPTGGTMKWAVSQALPFRRMHIRGDIVLHQDGGWASGGWMSDDLIDGNVGAGPQQQWISRNTEWGSWTGANWNMVFVGVVSPPAGEWPNPPYTKIAQVPIVREKPFLEVDPSGKYTVRVPALRANSSGITWQI